VRCHSVGCGMTGRTQREMFPFTLFQCRNFRIPGVSIFRNLYRYELGKIRSPWLRLSMHFRSLDCDGAGAGAR